MPKKTRVQYYVTETKRGGKNRRRCYGSTGTKEQAQRYAVGMRKSFGDKFTYRLHRETV